MLRPTLGRAAVLLLPQAYLRAGETQDAARQAHSCASHTNQTFE